MVRPAEVTMEAPDFEEPPPPPEEEQEEPEPPPPSLDDAPEPLNLNIDLDFASGGGGVLESLKSFAQGNEAESMLDAFSLSDLEQRPEVVASVAPIYPADMRKAKIEGTVTLIFILNAQGSVEDPRVKRSSLTAATTLPSTTSAALLSRYPWPPMPRIFITFSSPGRTGPGCRRGPGRRVVRLRAPPSGRRS